MTILIISCHSSLRVLRLPDWNFHTKRIINSICVHAADTSRAWQKQQSKPIQQMSGTSMTPQKRCRANEERNLVMHNIPASAIPCKRSDEGCTYSEQFDQTRSISCQRTHAAECRLRRLAMARPISLHELGTHPKPRTEVSQGDMHGDMDESGAALP